MTAVADRNDLWTRLAPLASVDAVNEEQRLAALRAYRILDTEPEDAYDRVVELARTLFGAPLAAVGLIDETRLWFKARSGFDSTEEPRAIVFCDHVIRQDDVMVVPDMLLDPRFVDNPLVTGGPQIRFYAGAPLRAPGGERLGTVCVMSQEPRTDFSEADCRRLAALSGIVSHELELRLQASRAERLAAERGMLLQAIDHRLRSGLQLVTCVLQAQAMRHVDSAARRALYEAADRVAMIEAAHQQLFQASDVFEADAREYLLALIGNLQDALVDDDGGRALVVDLADHMPIDAERLPVVGLVLTELLTNALRHGAGHVEVRISCEPGSEASPGSAVTITVTDQGAGFPPDFASAEGARRLGLRLVAMLALPGGVSIDQDRRQRITVRVRV